MNDIGIPVLEKIKSLEIDYLRDMFSDDSKRDQKINEIIEKVNILIQMKIDEVNRR